MARSVLERHKKDWHRYSEISSRIGELQSFLVNSDIKSKLSDKAKIEEIKIRLYNLQSDITHNVKIYKSTKDQNRRSKIHRDTYRLNSDIKLGTSKIKHLEKKIGSDKDMKRLLKKFKKKIKDLTKR